MTFRRFKVKRTTLGNPYARVKKSGNRLELAVLSGME